MTDVEARPEDVGQVLVKVQEDIRQLREHLIGKGDGKTISVADFENALRKTEQGLQRQTEDVVHRLNNQVKTLPLGDTLSGQESQVFSFDSSWDPRSKALVHASSSNKLMVRRSGRDLLPRQPLPPGQRLLLRERVEIQGPSKGQEMRNQNLLRAVYNPLSQANRPVLQESYGIQLPLIPQKPEPRPPPKPVTGTTVDHLTVLPKANRVDAQLAPPPISEEDARKGIMSLIERGLIPPAANLTLDPSPVRHKLARLHDPQDKAKPVSLSDMQSTLAGFKLDMRTSSSQQTTAMESSIPRMPAPQRPSSQDQRTYSAKSRDTSTTMQAKTPISVRTYEMPRHPLPPPTTPASGDVKSLSHRFAVQHGRVKDSQPEFLAFKQHYCLTWGSIVTMLKYLERMLIKYAVPVAFINGDKLADLSVEFELEKPPRVQDLLTVIVNREDVEAIINKPGRRYQGPNGVDLAATYIQASWRRFRDRSFYLDFRRKKWAAGVIAISWIMHIKMARVRLQLRQTRLDQLEASRARAKKFAASWDRIKTSKRVVIHIPSLGLSQNIRDSINDFSVRQNSQMARLCDIKDPNVDVIYISPVPMTDETLQYYAKLLGLHDAIESGEVEDQKELPNRYKILVPEAIKSFPTHRMCLSTLLKYSPNTMRRLKNLVRGREAFMVPTVPHRDDLAVADFLNVPILAPEPEVAHLYSTKSGCKRIFASANSAMPPGEYDIYSLGQLHECLAQLVTENLNVKRWLFKLDDEFDGRGIAYCDVTEHLKCYHWACKEAARYGEKWNKKWAQEGAYIKIHAEVPDIVAKHSFPVNTKAYANWDKFLEAFLSQGGVIEACPPSDSITTISVDMFIEPNGRTEILTLGDQIHAESQFSCWGLSFPQSSVEPHVLNHQCHAIANACKSRGILGYFTIDFVTFIDPTTMEQELWALDLSLSYSESLAMYQLLGFITRGVLDTNTHQFQVTPPRNATRPRRRRLLGQTEDEPVITNRYAVMSTRLLHTNLGVVHYSVFFQMCRAHGIGYDIKEKQGTVFTLQDSFNRERLGMITVGDNLQGVLATYARNLSVIHQEISAPKMQGTTNFRLAIEDIESILGTTVQNSEEPEEKETTG